MNKIFHLILTDRKELSDVHLQIRRMCHDLNSPLRAIHGFADILQRREAGNLSDRGNMYLQRMVAATQTMEQIVNRIQDYARLLTHPVEMQPILISLFSDEVIHQLSLPAGASVQVQVSKTLSWKSDTLLLSTILRELLDNSLLYSTGAAKVNVEWGVEQEELVLIISDSGIGIDVEYHQRIFDLFERLHGRDEYPGAGVGLTMVLKAVSMLGGRISLSSDTASGTCVRINFPVFQPGEVSV